MISNELNDVANKISSVMGNIEQKCFLCFGTLLRFIRDREFSIEGDIDIGIIGTAEPAISAFSSVFTPLHIVRDDITKSPYQMTFRSKDGISIDLFFWRKRAGHYYHCYDDRHVFSESGILQEYTFKGIPASCFDVQKEIPQAYMKDMRYRGCRSNGTWDKPFPQDPTTGYSFPVPFNYGHCLDYWYPDWCEKRPQFGVSEAANTFTVKSCKGIGWEK